MKKEILNQLKSEYETLEIRPSADLWDKMEIKLNIEGTSAKNTETHFQWWRYAAVILLMISVGSLIYYLNTDQIQTEKNTLIVRNNTSDQTQKDRLNMSDIEEMTNTNFGQSKAKETVISDLKHKTDNTNSVVKYNTNKTNSVQYLGNIKEDLKIVQIPTQHEKVIININRQIKEEKINNQISIQPVIAEKKKINYVKADELLVGREFDKTREEYNNEDNKFGVLDIGNIKIKTPNSLKILGVTVYSSSLESK